MFMPKKNLREREREREREGERERERERERDMNSSDCCQKLCLAHSKFAEKQPNHKAVSVDTSHS